MTLCGVQGARTGLIRMQEFAPVAIRRAGKDDAAALISLEQVALEGVIGRTGLTDWLSLFAEPGVFPVVCVTSIWRWTDYTFLSAPKPAARAHCST